MAGMQETDRLTLKNGITYLLKDAAAREKLADLLTEVMEKYGTDNPPPYPVTSVNGQTGDVQIQTGGAVDSVNGQTGAVELDANDVGALPNTTQIPSKTSDLANDSGFVNAVGAAAAAPVKSVNGQTGAVTVHGVPAGGTKGQVMKKASDADYDADWENESGGSGSGIAIQDDEPTDGELVWIDTDDPGTTHIIPEIDDTQESASDTWSSQKIAGEITMMPTTDWRTAYNNARSFILVNFSESYAGDVRQFTITIPKAQIISTNREFGDLVAFASTSDYSYVKVTCSTTACTATRYWYNGANHYAQPDTVTFYYM